MIRTQIYIPQKTYNKLKLLAKEENKPMTEIIRNFIDKGLNKLQQKDRSGKKIL